MILASFHAEKVPKNKYAKDNNIRFTVNFSLPFLFDPE